MCREAIGAPFTYQEKRALYRRAGGHCEHPDGCQEQRLDKLTVDHLTPQCVAKFLGWSLEQMDSHDNLTLLCRTHHELKDATTEAKKAQVLQQMNGQFIPFGGHK